MALLLLAHQWAQEKGGHVVALTLDHGLRPDAPQEAKTVQRWAQARQIQHVILTWEGDKPTTRLQEKAREARYQLLTSWCKAHHISTLLLGHHLQDQEETFWMRLSAGSGLDGLTGMRESTTRNGIRIIRPLLHLNKDQLKSFLRAENQPWLEDPSNQNNGFFRARFRSFLKEEGLSSGRLAKTLGKFQEDADFIHQSLQAALKKIAVFHENGDITLHKSAFAALHPALSKRLLVRIFEQFSGSLYPPRSKKIEGILKKLQGSTAFTAGGLYWTQTAEEIQLRREIGRDRLYGKGEQKKII